MYTYDVEDPDYWGSNDNRLMVAKTYDSQDVLMSTAWYDYYRTDDGGVGRATGNVHQIVTKNAGSSWYFRTYFLYDSAGRAGPVPLLPAGEGRGEGRAR